MSKDQQFHQFGYEHYLKAPKRTRVPQESSFGKRTQLFRQLQSPAMATVALLCAAFLFVGVIAFTYPSDEALQQPIPIVRADDKPFKKAPDDPGGMSIPHYDSTVLALSRPLVEDETRNIENLLAPSEDKLVTKEVAIEAAMARSEDAFVQTPPVAEAGDLLLLGDEQEIGVLQPDELPEPLSTASVIDLDQEVIEIVNRSVEVVTADAFVSDIDAIEIKEPVSNTSGFVVSGNEVLQKIGGDAKADVNSGVVGEKVSNTSEYSLAFVTGTAEAALTQKPRKKKLHAPGQSPKTIDFVRSVLNEKQAAIVEPSAGAAREEISRSAPLSSGKHFVQLSSIKDSSRAASEWKKMQQKYGVLVPANYRVQEAALKKGTFYRIQAGPMSESDAKRVCNALKAQNKPGGCIVVR